MDDQFWNPTDRRGDGRTFGGERVGEAGGVARLVDERPCEPLLGSLQRGVGGLACEVLELFWIVNEVKEKTQGHKFRLECFDRYPDITETPTGILSAEFEAAMMLKSTVQDTLVDWFGMEDASATTAEAPIADVVVVMEAGMGEKSLDEILQAHYDAYPKKEGKSVAIVLTSSYHSGPKIDSHNHFRIFYLQQP